MNRVRLCSKLCALTVLVSLLGFDACKAGSASTPDDADVLTGQEVAAADAPADADSAADTAPDQESQADLCPSVEAPNQADWYHSGVGYEIFVRSFADSNGDGIGDLKGIEQKLDYLNDGNDATHQDLGVTWIWLTPIFKSPSYHGYDTTDYRAINPEYGTLQDLKDLVAACHQRGIKIIVDLVLNHVGVDHPWFQEAKDPSSAKRNWFIWTDKPLDWVQPWSNSPVWHQAGDSWYYGVFWSGMPDLNYNNAEVRQEMNDIATYWLSETGIDGYRLDAVRYLIETGPKEGQQDTPETLAFWKEFATTLKASYPNAMLVGEAWASNSIAALYRVGGEGLNMTFDFDLMEATVAGILAEEPADIEGALCRFPTQFPPKSGEVTFLSNHDLTRVFTRLKASSAGMRLASLLLLTLPGTPMLYYGDEIGQQNGPLAKDEHKRLPMQWDATASAGFTTGTPWQTPAGDYATVNVAAQTSNPQSLLSWYRQLIQLRRSTPALDHGGYTRLAASSVTTGAVWAFARTPAGTEKPVVVVVNFSNHSAVNVQVTLPETLPAPTTLLWPSAGAAPAAADGRLNVGDVPAMSGVILQ